MRSLILFITLLFSLSSHAKLNDGLYANMHTTKGNIIVQLAYEKAPLTVINFVGLAEGTKVSNKKSGKPFYSNSKFHRVIKNFMIQGGDPRGNGTGGPGYKFADEFSDLKHDRAGTLSMANSGPNTNGSQFFITHKPTPHLDGKHTVFGYVIEGIDTVNLIKKGDFIRKMQIIRIGEKAKNFQTDERAFQTYNKKNLEKEKQVKKQEKFINFVKTKYKNAKAVKGGYFVQIDLVGAGEKPKKGDKVKVNMSINLDDGTKIRQAGEPLTFSAGTQNIVGAIGQSVLEMNIGEKRTIIAHYSQIFGKSVPINPLIILSLELLSIK